MNDATGAAVTRADEGEYEERAKRQVYGAGGQDARRNPISRVQDHHRQTERKLFQHTHEHQRPIALDVARNEQEHELPRECNADESVEVFRLRNRRRKAQLDEVLRQQNDDPVYASEKKHALGEPRSEVHELSPYRRVREHD